MEQREINKIKGICKKRNNWGVCDSIVVELIEHIDQLQSELSGYRQKEGKEKDYSDIGESKVKELALRNVIAYKDDEIEELKKEVEQMRKLYMKLLLQIENAEG